MSSLPQEATPKPWAIVLAGGQGRRMRKAVRSWTGEDRPKQFCAFAGGHTMLEETWQRVDRLVPPERTYTVVGREQRSFLLDGSTSRGRIVEQPLDLGTAAGVLLPATYVLEQDPEAIVLLFPCDHYVHPLDRFVEHLKTACRAVAEEKHRPVLLAARADRPETDYGWIVPERSGPGIAQVQGFVEKPSAPEARLLLEQGALWNTMIVAVHIRTLWALAWRVLPEMMRQFEALRQVLHVVRGRNIDPRHEELFIAQIYRKLAHADFSRSILVPSARRCSVVELEGVDWSDWGRPARVLESLERLGVAPPRIAVAGGHAQPSFTGLALATRPPGAPVDPLH